MKQSGGSCETPGRDTVVDQLLMASQPPRQLLRCMQSRTRVVRLRRKVCVQVECGNYETDHPRSPSPLELHPRIKVLGKCLLKFAESCSHAFKLQIDILRSNIA